jgi:hypothetical protein
MGKWIQQTVLKKEVKTANKWRNVQHFHRTESSNENNSKILSQPSQNDYHQENKEQQMLARLQKKWKHYTLFLGSEFCSDVDIATGVSSRN